MRLSATFEELDLAFVVYRFLARLEGTEISTFAGLRVLF
jgi:hypothetical protein